MMSGRIDFSTGTTCSPLHATAAGCLLLALQPTQAVHAYFPQGPFRRPALRPQITHGMSKTTLRRVRKDGCAFVRDEIDDELLSLAIPVFAPDGSVVAALEWSGSTDVDEAAA